MNFPQLRNIAIGDVILSPTNTRLAAHVQELTVIGIEHFTLLLCDMSVGMADGYRCSLDFEEALKDHPEPFGNWTLKQESKF